MLLLPGLLLLPDAACLADQGLDLLLLLPTGVFFNICPGPSLGVFNSLQDQCLSGLDPLWEVTQVQVSSISVL